MRQFFLCMTILFVGVTAHASDFVFTDGFYVKDGWAYTRTAKQVRFLDSCNCWRTRTQYTYVKDHEIVAPVVVAPVVKADEYERYDWRPDMVKLAKQLQEWEYKLDLQAQDDAAFVEWSNALGLNRGYGAPAQQQAVQAGNQPYSLSAQFSSQTTPYAPQGQTLYGYNAFSQRFSDVDLQTLFNQANELAKNSQSLAGNATGDFSALVSQQSEQAGEIDRILARGQETEKLLGAITEILRDRATKTESSATINVNPTGPSPSGTNQAPQADGMSHAEWGKLLNLVNSKCVDCHNSEKKQGGFDLSNYRALSQSEKSEVLNSIRGAGKSGKMMPLDGDPLTEEEQLLFVRDYLKGAQQ